MQLLKVAHYGSYRSTVTALAERLQLAQSTVTELVGRAEEAGLLTREPSRADGRVAHLGLTERGEEMLAAAFTGLEAERRSLLSSLVNIERT